MSKLLNTKQEGIKAATEFSKRLRTYPELDSIRNGISITDVDYVFQDYSDPNFCKIAVYEEKSHGNHMSVAQQDTFSILNQCLWSKNGSLINTARGIKTLQFYGTHLIEFEIQYRCIF